MQYSIEKRFNQRKSLSFSHTRLSVHFHKYTLKLRSAKFPWSLKKIGQKSDKLGTKLLNGLLRIKLVPFCDNGGNLSQPKKGFTLVE